MLTLQIAFVVVTALWGLASVVALCIAKPEVR